MSGYKGNAPVLELIRAGLSPGQLQLAEFLLAGLGSREIARRMRTTSQVIKNAIHFSIIRSGIERKNRVGLVLYLRTGRLW